MERGIFHANPPGVVVPTNDRHINVLGCLDNRTTLHVMTQRFTPIGCHYNLTCLVVYTRGSLTDGMVCEVQLERQFALVTCLYKCGKVPYH